MKERRTQTQQAFYVAGGTLRSDAPCYVARDADERLVAALRAREFAYALTARQMGKSSLMIRVAKRLRTENWRVAIVDLTALGQNLTADQWYFGIAETIAEQAGLEPEGLEGIWERPKLSPMLRRSAAVEWILAQDPAAALAPDGHTVALASLEDGIRVIDLASHHVLARHTIQSEPRTMAFASDSRTLAISVSDELLVWKDLSELTRFDAPGVRGHGLAIFALSFSPHGDRLFEGITDAKICVWDWRNNKLIQVLEGHRGTVKALGLTPDGTVILWDAVTLQPILTYQESDRSIEAAAFSPNGRYLATSGDDHIIHLRDRSPIH